jgi:myo-inositol-1(or 4)-monophosphatase
MDYPTIAFAPASELAAWLAGATAVAVEAGEQLRQAQGAIEAVAIQSKSASVDLVSNADEDAERLIRAGLSRVLPSAGFIGEESPMPDLAAHDLFWCVDPLDGTSNFLCGLPLWAVSIALVTPQLQPILGVVRAPLLNKTWAGANGLGATCNAVPIQVRVEPPGGGLQNSMLATGFPYDVTTASENHNIDYYTTMQRRFQKIRRLGSAAIDLAYVAEGTFDGMWELKLKPWDSAAGLVIAHEAGALTCTLEGKPYTPGDISLVAASNTVLLEEILRLIGSA